MSLRLAQVAVRLELLREERVRLLQTLLAVDPNETNHLIVLTRASVHVHCVVRLPRREIHLLRLLVPLVRLELLGAFQVQRSGRLLGHVPRGDSVRRLPLVRSTVHVHRVARFARAEETPLGAIEISRVLVVPRDAAIILDEPIVSLVLLHDLQRFLPVVALHRRLCRLHRATRVDEVIDRRLRLAELAKAIAPLLLQRANLSPHSALRAFAKLHRAAIRVPADVRLLRLFHAPERVVQLARAFVHVRASKRRANLLH